MNDKHLEKIREAVREEVKITVNGKIDKLKEHLERVEAKIDELKPLSEFQRAINAIRKFVIWIATPASIIYALIKWIQ